MSVMFKFIALMIMFCCFTILQHSFANNATGNFKTNIQMTANCSVSATDINFGIISPTSFNTATGSISVLCSKNVSYSMIMNDGLHYGTVHNLQGDASKDLINYGICTNASIYGCEGTGNQIWTRNPQTSIGTGLTQTFPAYAYTQGQYSTPDNYSDTVTLTLSY